MEPAARKTVPWWVKALVFFHAFAIVVWTLPAAPPKPWGSDWVLVYNQKLKNSDLKYYLISTGFWQYWDMFSPNPANQETWADALVTYADGSTKRYQYPRMKELSLREKYFKERYRKFYERAGQQGHSFMWPTFAQRIALLMYDDPKNPPIEVRLRRHDRRILPPDRPQVKDFKTTEYYRHVVNIETLKKHARQ